MFFNSPYLIAFILKSTDDITGILVAIPTPSGGVGIATRIPIKSSVEISYDFLLCGRVGIATKVPVKSSADISYDFLLCGGSDV